VSSLLPDLRYALRVFRTRPLHAVVTAVVLAIAIGANTTVFSVLNGLFLRPLPYPEGDRLVVVYDSYPKLNLENAGTAIPNYLDRRDEAKSLESLAILTIAPRTLGGDGEPERVAVERASASLFTVLRVVPQLGRAFTDAEATIGNDRVVVLSDRLWRTRFGASPAAIGRDARLDGETFRVIGVMPAGFGYPTRDVDAWVPFAFTPQQQSDAARGNQFSTSIGRLRPGASVEGLNAELAAIAQATVDSGHLGRSAIDVAGFTGRATPLRTLSVGNLASMVWLLQATVLAVLLIACANVANLQLGRVMARRKELALRAALGAGGRRLARLVLAESFVLALVGAAAGVILAGLGLELVRALGLDRASQGFEFRLDGSVLAFTLGTAVIAALISGLPPVIALLRDDLTRAVQEAGRLGTGGRSTRALRAGLVVTQIAVSVALLAGAGLLTKSFYRLQAEGPGFNAGGVWTAGLALPTTRYSSPQSWPQFERRALDALSALPGVTAASFTSVLPFAGNNSQGSFAIGSYVAPFAGSPPHAQNRSISEAYLPTLGIPVIEGRNFEATEPERVVIVDTNIANKYWPQGSAIGQRVREINDPPDRWYTVIGVVPAVKQADLAETPAKETIYWHYAQRPQNLGRIALRTTLPPDSLTAAAKAAIAALDPELALFQVQPLDAFVERSLGTERTPMVLTLIFAAVAFTLAVIGIYGVLSWAVTQRTGEFGVRMALGARSSDLVRMVLGQGGRLIALGLVVGAAAAVLVGRLLATQVAAVSAFDPAVLAVAVGGLGATALLASWLPARRAAAADPMQALRQE
jgi:putative ABC transport system permease protein